MTNHIVLSPYSFVGFEICNCLMEEGMEVTGVDLPVEINPMEKEEKELFLGRNSNFKVMKHDEMMRDPEHNDYIYISDQYEKWLEYIEKIPSKNKKTIVYVVMDTRFKKTIPTLINTTIILPTVYGPWQPKDTFLYKCLSQERFPFEQYDLEDKNDAIYSSDAAAAILEISMLEHGIYRVQTDIKDHWRRLLKELGYEVMLDARKTNYPFISETDVKKYRTNTKISPEEGIDMVKRHIRNREILGY